MTLHHELLAWSLCETGKHACQTLLFAPVSLVTDNNVMANLGAKQ